MTRLRFEYIPVSRWPSLAWLSRCKLNSDVVEVFHGLGVETTNEWFSEAVWAGEFTDGGFDQTDIVAGSGGRAREKGVVFVTSASTVDRLQSLVTAQGTFISNSICCLLAMGEGSLDPAYPHFHADFSSINKGLSKYKPHLKSSIGLMELSYFDNLIWTGKALHREPKVMTAFSFTSFEEYRDFLGSNMHNFVKNALASSRQQIFQPLCALSNGYDSPTVAAMAKQYGNCLKAISFDVDRNGVDDSGEPIATSLGMNYTVIPREMWRSMEQPEIPFIAGSPSGSDVLWAGAESQLAGSLLLTGFFGDAVWAEHYPYPASDLARGDGSGRSLTEYRLHTKFIHCPVPFWGARLGKELMAISQSPKMQAWKISGNYSRPICRRIVEAAGVPREMFGIGKRGVSVQLHRYENFLTSKAHEDYLAWLKGTRASWIRQYRLPPIPAIANGLDATLTSLRGALRLTGDLLPSGYGFGLVRSILQRSASKISSIQVGVEAPLYLRRYTFPWAVEQIKARYPVP